MLDAEPVTVENKLRTSVNYLKKEDKKRFLFFITFKMHINLITENKIFIYEL
jgi:hypothetical protein